ncbi:MAG: hypothetical protein ACRDQX_07120 [Pseudonocardiaceae bacterium]
MTVLTPNEKLTGTPHQKREIYERLTRFRQQPDHTLTLSKTYPALAFQTLDQVLPGFGDREVFALGVRLARERFAELGLSELLPHERVFVGVASTRPAWGGFHYPNPAPEGLPPGYRYVQAAAVITRYGDLHGDMPSTSGVAGVDLIRSYTHDCFHWGTFRSYRLGTTGIHRNQHGINFRRENGGSYSARDPQGSASTRNLGVIMEGAFDREAKAVVRDVAAIAGIPCPTARMDRHAWHDSTGHGRSAPDSANPWLTAMNSYAASVTAPYAAFLAEIGGPDSDELHELIIRATLDGNLSPLQSWLEDRYGPGEFTALFRSSAYSGVRVMGAATPRQTVTRVP